MNVRFHLLFICLLVVLSFSSCSKEENDEVQADTELITEVTLLFSPFEGGAPVFFKASDPDGEGPEGLSADEEIILSPNTTYDLFIQLENDVNNPDVANEIEKEGAEHMFFFAVTEGMFLTPMGNGNIDERAEDAVVYGDEDVNGLPIGLITTWVTAAGGDGTFRILLKHQEDGLKTDISTSDEGATDLDITWDISLEQ